MATSETITVSIFDKDYPVSCPADEVQALRDSAFYLDQKMREIKKSGSVLGLDRLAVMAALNITNDFLSVARNSTDFFKEDKPRPKIALAGLK